MTVKLVSDATALLSMRDSDFDAYSAFGEVIDNSIQAEAKNIKIQLNYVSDQKKGRRKPYAVIREIAFGDDGYGMDTDTLHKCLQLGYSTRYNDRSGIGRFGVGMTLAAINQCKRVDIYSKQNERPWKWTYIDIDEITSTPPIMNGIPEPKDSEIPKKYSKLVDGNGGTLVIWSKYDRQPVSALKMIDEIKIWTGRTFRKFIWDNVNIYLNSEFIHALDPLYVCTDKAKFSNDPPSFEYTPDTISWKVPLIDKPKNSPSESDITIRLSLISETFRKYQGSGGSPEAKERCIDRNEGISILRNNREVFYGHIPYWPRKFDEIDRWWGCEISFAADLDRAFTVKNIKRGAIPVPDLKKAIYDRIKPTIKTALESVRDLWAETSKKEEQEKLKKDGALFTGHEDAEKVAAETTTDKSEIDKDKDKHKEAEKLTKNLKKDESENEQQKWALKFASQPFTIIDDSWKGPDFFETNHLGGADVIKYNRQHNFFEMLYQILKTLEEDTVELEHAKELKSLIDLLIISYSKAEAKFERELTWTAEEFIDNLRLNWGQYLRNYMNTWMKG